MSAKADKGDRKREIEQSPMKKKFRDSAISSEELDSAIFVFYSRHLYFYLFYIISKGIFHIGGLVSKMHISVYGLFTEWKCFCFLFFFAFIVYNLGIMNIQCIL